MIQNQDVESRIYGGDKAVSFNPRLGFIRKVYGILGCQLLVTTAITAAMILVPTFNNWVCPEVYINGYDQGYCNPSSGGITILIISFVVSMISLCSIVCCMNVARKVPTNYIMLTIFTLSESYIVAWISSMYAGTDVLLALLLTASITFALTIYACTTKTDFTWMGGLLFILGWSLCAFGCMFIFWWASPAWFQMSIACYCVLAVILYGFYLIYDTQLIVGGRKYKLSMDDYVIGALLLYIDIIQLFLKLLQIIGAARGR